MSKDHVDLQHFRAVSTFKIGHLDISPESVQALLDEHEHATDKHGYDHVLTNPDMAEQEKFAALVEEIGEVAQLLTYDKRPPEDPEPRQAFEMVNWRNDLAKELLQVANLALAWRQSVVEGGS